VRAFFRRWRRGGSDQDKIEPAPAHSDAAVDIVDQAAVFKTLRIEDLMTPRADIVAVEIDTPFDELLARFLDAEHTRMPIFRETLDDPVGQVHVKDVFKMLVAPDLRPAPDEPVLRRLRRELLYVPGSMRAADLMVKMQATRIHMALVIDEFGGTDGLVTLEDLIEAVVGEIDDEHDEAVHVQVIARTGGVFEANGRAPLEDLEEALGASLVPADLDEEAIREASTSRSPTRTRAGSSGCASVRRRSRPRGRPSRRSSRAWRTVREPREPGAHAAMGRRHPLPGRRRGGRPGLSAVQRAAGSDRLPAPAASMRPRRA
jgi:CBS domain-containing protein